MRPAGLILSLLAAFPATAAAPAATRAPAWPVLDALRGKVVLLDFWASWCSPCLQSFPWMNELQQRHGDEGLVVVAVNLDQDRSLADAFLAKRPAGFRIEYDAAGVVAREFDVQAMPTSFLIDRDGNVRLRHAGFKQKQREEREAEIVKLLEESR